MKARSKQLAGPAPPILAMVTLLLTLGMVATTPLALAKYVASATVTASARVAKFSFKVTTTEFKNQGGEKEIAVTAGVATPFTIPLFDTEYYASGASSGTPTVQSSNGDLVIAPGVNSGEGIPVNNPNKNSSSDSRKVFVLKNESEVAVTYRLEFVPSSVSGHAYNTNPFEVTTYLQDGTHLGTTYLHRQGTIYNTAYGQDFKMRDTKNGPSPKVLQPGDEETLLFDFRWWYYWGDQGINPATGLGNADEGDTALGKAAVNADIWVEPQFLLTVEQVD